LDSVTQAALGAAVGVAAMGRTRPVWQSALAGAVIGTLPDLDVFIDEGDPIRNMVLHRAETHALFWQMLAAPVIAGVLALVTRTGALFGRWWLLVLLGLFTHSILDAMTVYGTQLALPFSSHPFGLGSLYIIDPMYTLPLLLGLILALLLRAPNRLRWNAAGLTVSAMYAVWSVGAQALVTNRVQAVPEARPLSPDRILVTPTPFNTLLWRVVLLHDDHYQEGFYSLLDPLREPSRPMRFEKFQRRDDLDRRTRDFADANLIRAFSKGFYSLADDGRHIQITDLRMGQHPYYAFSFAFAEHHSEPLVPITPLRITNRMPIDPGLDWLWRRLQGMDVSAPGRATPDLTAGERAIPFTPEPGPLDQIEGPKTLG
jgi:inner membrane protein